MVKKIFNKKNIKFFVPLALLLLMAIGVLVFCLAKDEKESKNLSLYEMKLSFQENDKILSGEEKVTYYNNTDNAFDKLYFHLYPNAFREGAKASVVSAPLQNEAYPNGKSYGDITIKNVNHEKDNFNYHIVGEDENILEVELGQKIFPSESVSFTINFDVKLPNINHRFGYGENTINFGNFYPILCAYEEGQGFSQALYHSNGDPFYSDCANYNVEITYSKDFTLVSTGESKKLKAAEEKKVEYIEARKVRDFCFVLSDKLEKVSESVEGVKINYYGYDNDENLDKCLSVSRDALKTFNELFGKYPYKTLNIVKSNFVHGGMEYPGIVLISDKFDLQEDINYCIVHEIAHQWWYGVVGNDEYNDAWFDEGLAEFSSVLFYKYNSKYNMKYKDMVSNSLKNYITFEEIYTRVTGKVDGRMDRALNEFDTEPEYSQCVYTKGVLMHDSLKNLLGEKKYLKVLKSIYEEFAFKNISRAEFTSVFEKKGGKAAAGIINSYLDGKVILKTA